jgi:hypothetical protein
MPDLGRKYTCYSCHTKFYDLGKPIPLCPKCGADQRDAEDAPAVSTPRRSRVVVEPEPVEEPDFVAEEPGPVAEAGEEEEETFVEPEREEEPEEDEEEEEF